MERKKRLSLHTSSINRPLIFSTHCLSTCHYYRSQSTFAYRRMIKKKEKESLSIFNSLSGVQKERRRKKRESRPHKHRRHFFSSSLCICMYNITRVAETRKIYAALDENSLRRAAAARIFTKKKKKTERKEMTFMRCAPGISAVRENFSRSRVSRRASRHSIPRSGWFVVFPPFFFIILAPCACFLPLVRARDRRAWF